MNAGKIFQTYNQRAALNTKCALLLVCSVGKCIAGKLKVVMVLASPATQAQFLHQCWGSLHVCFFKVCARDPVSAMAVIPPKNSNHGSLGAGAQPIIGLGM